MSEDRPPALRRVIVAASLPVCLFLLTSSTIARGGGSDSTGIRLLRSGPAVPPAAARPPGSITGTIGGDIGIVWDDAFGYFTSPASFGTTDWNRAAAGLGAFGIIMGMDEPLSRLLATHPRQGALEEPLEWGKEWGRLRTMQYASIGTYFGGLIAGDEWTRVTGRLMGEALLLAGAPAIVLQYGLGRSRPREGTGAYRYNFFEWKNEFQSLPSGHATVAFAVSTVLAKRIHTIWAGVPLYSIAGLAALSLTWGKEHWPSDVLLGSALGYLAGSYVVSREDLREAGGDNEARTGEAPGRFSVGIGVGGLTLTYLIF